MGAPPLRLSEVMLVINNHIENLEKIKFEYFAEYLVVTDEAKKQVIKEAVRDIERKKSLFIWILMDEMNTTPPSLSQFL